MKGLKGWLKSKQEKAESKRRRAIVSYDLRTAGRIAHDVVMFDALLNIVEGSMIKTLKYWLSYEVELTRHEQAAHLDNDRLGHAQQQKDFRAALQKVLTKIDLMERTE